MIKNNLELIKNLQVKPIVIKQPTFKDVLLTLTPNFLLGTLKYTYKNILTLTVFTIVLYLVSLSVLNIYS